ncbi:MAG: hypothetical protein ABW061_05510 [Polyangiaceae bacterium]
MGCSSDATPAPSDANAGADSGGASGRAGADSGGAAGDVSGDVAGSDSSDAGDDAGGASAAGSNSAGASSAGAPAVSAQGPCVYSVTGGQSFPEGAATFLCSGGSRVLQQKGEGDFDILVGAAFGTEDNHSSTIACSLTSKEAPAAGDVWVLGKDHPGNCDLSYSQGTTASLWKSTSTPAGTGSTSIKFLSATLTHGQYKPEDVYYLFEVEITGTLPGETADTPEVTLNGTFKITTLPLGG